MAGIYIHVPFCISKCTYCDFYSVANIDHQVHRSFLLALTQEIRSRAYELEGTVIETIYIGGGTPSLIPADEIGNLLTFIQCLHHVSANAEITIECNPGDLSQLDIHRLIEVGINRFSIGVQSFDARLLQFLTRRHGAQASIDMVHALQDAGVLNYSLDLIYGIPGETIDMLRHDLRQLIALHPTHISAYHLMYEQGTPLTEQLMSGKINEVTEDLSLKMFDTVNRTLAQAGYEHYEVSNYALSGYRSLHNSSYWQGLPYQGLGPSAHSFMAPWRSWNPRSVRQYTKQLLSESHFLVRDFEFITQEMSYMEYILTRLRTIEGLSLTEIKKIYGTQKISDLYQKAAPMFKIGLLSEHNDHIRLTDSGILVSDSIIQELV